MAKICAICKSKDKKLFDSPKDQQRRKAWSAACGIEITEKSAVCILHFTEADFCFYGRGTSKAKLKTGALPKNLPLIKLEPEFVTVNDEVPCETFESSIEIKDEPIESRSCSFINEECFDVNPDDPIQTLNSNRAAHFEKDVGASTNPTVKTLSCGQIIMETTSDGFQTYKLICDHCKTTFSTKDVCFWSNFVKHINEAHIPAPHFPPAFKDRTIDELSLKQQTTEIQTTYDQKTLETNNHKNDFEAQMEAAISELTNEVNNDLNEDLGDDDSFNDDSRDFDDSEWEDETFEPKGKKQKTESKRKKAPEVKIENSIDVDTKRTPTDIISFNHPDKNCVITFLELLTSRAILWLPRQSIMKRFDEALIELTSKFNEFFPRYALTKEQTRQSLKTIKDLYQRLSDGEKQNDKKSGGKRRLKTSEYKTKFPEYFELCAEIEENSKNILQNCELCERTFYSAQDLQVHKYKKHKIGELPYKCQRCCYGFACAEKLASHEEKHNRIKSFKCDICGQRFYAESKLQAHMVLHTDDSKQVCEICGKKFPSLSKYRRHKLHHEAPKEKCELCGKLYFEKWTLSEHMKSHKNKREYRCDICGKTFNRQEGVTIHKRGVHKIKTQTKKYVWVNRVTSSMSNTENASSSQNEEDQVSLNGSGNGNDRSTADTQNTNSNSTSFSSPANDETVSYDVKPTLPNDNNTTNQQNIFPLEMLSLLN